MVSSSSSSIVSTLMYVEYIERLVAYLVQYCMDTRVMRIYSIIYYCVKLYRGTVDIVIFCIF